MRARISGVASFSGEIQMISTEASTDSSAPITRVVAAERKARGSRRATAMPMAMIGPISGEISIAPMITATEDCRRPSAAMPQALNSMKP